MYEYGLDVNIRLSTINLLIYNYFLFIVISAFKEPFPGWVDTVNGCIGVAIVTGKGVLRTMLVDPKKQGDLIPVDIVCNALIAIPWSRAEKNKLVNNINSFSLIKSNDPTYLFYNGRVEDTELKFLANL